MFIKPGSLFFVVLVVFTGCGFNKPYVDRVDVRPRQSLTMEAPSDIVVLPMAQELGNPRVQLILPDLRRAVYRGLISRCYTPLDLALVDRGLGDQGGNRILSMSALRGKFNEDAILQLRVTGWSELKFISARKLRAAVELALVSSASGKELLGGTMEVEVEIPGHGGIGRDRLEQMRLRAVKRLAKRVVEEFPQRSELITK